MDELCVRNSELQITEMCQTLSHSEKFYLTTLWFPKKGYDFSKTQSISGENVVDFVNTPNFLKYEETSHRNIFLQTSMKQYWFLIYTCL